jgi:hypothetical protein
MWFRLKDRGNAMTTAAEPTSDRTRQFARILGPYLVIAGVAAIMRAAQMKMMLAEFSNIGVASWITGALVLVVGLTIVALHQNWHGAAAIAVSALGWLTLLKGALLLAMPKVSAATAAFMIDRNGWWQALMVLMIILGFFLTYVGWAEAIPSRSTSAVPQSSSDLRKAA